MKKLKSRKGMTLIELVVTVAILSIVATMGVGIFASAITNYMTASRTSSNQSDSIMMEQYIITAAQVATDVEFIPDLTSPSPSDTLPDPGINGTYISNTLGNNLIDIYEYDGTNKDDDISVNGVKNITLQLKRHLVDTTGDQDFIYLDYEIVMNDDRYNIKGSVVMNNMKPSEFSRFITTTDSSNTTSSTIPFVIKSSSMNTAVVFKHN